MHDLPPIVVAEDDDDDFYFLRRAIRQAAIDNPLLRFRDGVELTRFLEQIPPAEVGPARDPWLLLLDVTMPIMNGFEVLQWLATHQGLPRLLPIMLSASYRREDIDRALKLGAIDYLVKPITAQQIAIIAAKQLVPTLSH